MDTCAHKQIPLKPSRARGFTLIELMAVVLTVATLAALLLPVLGRTRIKAQRTNCMSNLRQLGLAWNLYSAENNGRLVESYPQSPNVWVQGDMTRVTDVENLSLLERGKLFPYNRSTAIYRCPADEGVKIAGRHYNSVRSYSMNSFMGWRDPALGPIPSTAQGFVLFYEKESEIPHPADMWVLLDEDERSINDGFFVTDPAAGTWIDYPATSVHRHNYSFTLALADGHSEVWRYHDPRTRHSSITTMNQAGNLDLERLASASTTRR